MSNIYNGSVHRYHQWLYEQTDAIIEHNLDRAAIVVLLRTLGNAQRLSKTSFTWTTAAILKDTGLHRQTWATARKQLNDSGLVKIEQARGKGVWKVTLPVTYRYLDLETCTSDEIRAYYLQYVSDAVDGGDRLVSTCPFHGKKKQFTVKLREDIDSRIGTWSCFCHGQQSGRILAFEQQKTGVNEKQAHRNVTDFFIDLRKNRIPAPIPGINVDAGVDEDPDPDPYSVVEVPPQYRPRAPFKPTKKTEAV